MSDAATACPVPGCERLKSRSHLMCPAHWRRVPKAAQAEVLDSWAVLRHCAPGNDIRTVIVRYRAAREAAIGAVASAESGAGIVRGGQGGKSPPLFPCPKSNVEWEDAADE